MFIIPSLEGGGAEKVLIEIIGHLDAEKYAISLVLFEKKGVHLLAIPDYVEIYALKKKNRYSFFKIILLLASLFREIEPDTTLSFMSYTNIIAILSKLLSGRKFKLVISIHINLALHLLYARSRKIKEFFYRRLFNYANFIIVPSAGIKSHLVKAFNLKQERIKVIYNPIDLFKIDKLEKESLDNDALGKYILAVGRLIKQKGYPYLLRAYSLIYKGIKEKLVILGKGEDEKKLRQLAKDLGIQERVLFLGFKNNPYKFMNNASLFVLSSLWEAFAIVIIEAMVCGVPVISTDCPYGPSEIIINGKNGILVPPADEKAVAEAMLNLLKNKNLRKQLSEEGRKRAKDFRIEKILRKYEELF